MGLGVWWRREAYGPRSEGVTGSEGGGGRFMRVGVDIVMWIVTLVDGMGFWNLFVRSLSKKGRFAAYGSRSWSSRLFVGVLAGVAAEIRLKQ